MNDTNPALIFGFGTWEQIKNRFLYCCDDGNSGNVGGSTKHTHKYGFRYASGYCCMKGLDNSDFVDVYDDGVWRRTTSSTTAVSIMYDNTNTNQCTTAYLIDASGNVGSTSNMPPYMTVYARQRKA